MMKQESLADAKVSAWQQCMAPSKSTANQRYAISYWRYINRGRITNRIWYIFAYRNKSHILTFWLKTLAEERPAISTKSIYLWKVYLVGYNTVYLHSFSRCCLPTKSREIPSKFEFTAFQGHPRSSILVPIERAYATSYQSYS